MAQNGIRVGTTYARAAGDNPQQTLYPVGAVGGVGRVEALAAAVEAGQVDITGVARLDAAAAIIAAGQADMGAVARIEAAAQTVDFDIATTNPRGWWDMAQSNTLFQNAAGTTPTTTSSQPIARINDRSGNNKHLTNPSSAAWPAYAPTAGPGGRPIASFGVNNWLSTATAISTSDTTIFVVCAHPNTSGSVWGRGGGITDYLYRPQGNTVLVGFNGSRGGTFGGINNAAVWKAANVFAVYAVRITPGEATTIQLFRNGTSFGTSTTLVGTNLLNDMFTIAADTSNGADRNGLLFAEAVFCAYTTLTQVAQVTASLMQKWGITP